MMNSGLLAVLLIASIAAASVLLSTQNAVASPMSIPLIDEEETVEGGNATTTTTMMANQTGGNMTGNNSTS